MNDKLPDPWNLPHTVSPPLPEAVREHYIGCELCGDLFNGKVFCEEAVGILLEAAAQQERAPGCTLQNHAWEILVPRHDPEPTQPCMCAARIEWPQRFNGWDLYQLVASHPPPTPEDR